MTMRAFAALAALIVVLSSAAACGDQGAELESTSLTPPATIDTSTWRVYQDRRHGFELKYPEEAQLSEGTRFAVPFASARDVGTQIDLPFAPGTNLLEKYLFIMVTDEPSDACPAPEMQQDATLVRSNGVDFWKTETIAAMMGHSWGGATYWAANGGSCVMIHTVLYSFHFFFGNPPPLFDADEESEAFRAMLATFRWLEQ